MCALANAMSRRSPWDRPSSSATVWSVIMHLLWGLCFGYVAFSHRPEPRLARKNRWTAECCIQANQPDGMERDLTELVLFTKRKPLTDLRSHASEPWPNQKDSAGIAQNQVAACWDDISNFQRPSRWWCNTFKLRIVDNIHQVIILSRFPNRLILETFNFVWSFRWNILNM